MKRIQHKTIKVLNINDHTFILHAEKERHNVYFCNKCSLIILYRNSIRLCPEKVIFDSEQMIWMSFENIINCNDYIIKEIIE